MGWPSIVRAKIRTVGGTEDPCVAVVADDDRVVELAGKRLPREPS